MLINGQCQCGTISFTLDWGTDPEEIPARACTCSFCRAHAGVWTSSPSGKLKVRLAPSSRVTQHRFATETAQFYVCSGCGEVPFVTSRIDGQLFAVVNATLLQGEAATRLRIAPASFEGESVAAKIERRRQRWIAEVVIHEDEDGA